MDERTRSPTGDQRNGDHRNGDPRNGDPRNGDPRNGDHRNGRRPPHLNGSPRNDSGSEVYVTSAAYRPPSEIR